MQMIIDVKFQQLVIEKFYPQKGKTSFIDKDKVVPLTLNREDYDILLITGPNTGGKTVALKTAGLLT